VLSRGRQALKAFGLSLWQVVNSRLPGLLPGELLRERGLHKPSAPEHDNINPQTLMLPSDAAANELRRDRVGRLSDAELAQIKLVPWDLADLCEVPSNEQWAAVGQKLLPWLRIASVTVRLEKEDLVHKVGKFSDQMVGDLMEGLGECTYRLRTLLALAEEMQCRLPVALAVLCEAEQPEAKSKRNRRQAHRRA
jgi:hypothetical protein